MINQRRENLLCRVVEEHVKTAQPIGSALLADKYFGDLSPATLRNEMMALTADGYLVQPHTSAGRVPTTLGYRYYLDNFLKTKELTVKQKEFLNKAKMGSDDFGPMVKELAKATAELSGNTVFVGFAVNNVYYTGLTNLFAQPEFENIDFVRNMSRIIDHLDDAMKDLFGRAKEKAEALIGPENPFAKECASVCLSYQNGREKGILGLLGPIRMDYGQNIALLEYIKDLIAKK